MNFRQHRGGSYDWVTIVSGVSPHPPSYLGHPLPKERAVFSCFWPSPLWTRALKRGGASVVSR